MIIRGAASQRTCELELVYTYIYIYTYIYNIYIYCRSCIQPQCANQRLVTNTFAYIMASTIEVQIQHRDIYQFRNLE